MPPPPPPPTAGASGGASGGAGVGAAAAAAAGAGAGAGAGVAAPKAKFGGMCMGGGKAALGGRPGLKLGGPKSKPLGKATGFSMDDET